MGDNISSSIFYVCLYDIVNIVAWVLLAKFFGHWWIALFSVITMLRGYRYEVPDEEKEKKNDNSGIK